MVEDGAFSHKIDYFTIVFIPNLEGHLNCTIGSKVMAILLNGWILPISLGYFEDLRKRLGRGRA